MMSTSIDGVLRRDIFILDNKKEKYHHITTAAWFVVELLVGPQLSSWHLIYFGSCVYDSWYHMLYDIIPGTLM